MKLFIRFLILFIILAGSLQAQVGRGKITAAEFFFDTDPGQGSATALTLQGNATDLLRNAIQSASQNLAVGKHTLNLRMKDSLGHWGVVFKTTLSVESPATSRSINASIARVYWDANVAGAVNMIMLNGNISNAINSFITSSPLNTFPAAGDHTINVQVLDAGGQWSPPFTTVLAVEAPVAAPRAISASLARVYWDANVGGAVNMIIQNGSVANAINSFITSTSINTFPSPGDHNINVQILDANGQWGTTFKTTISVESPVSFTRIISAALGRVYWDNNTGSSFGLIILNGNAGNAVNEFITASSISTFSTTGLHKLNVQLLDPNGNGNYSPAFSTVINVETNTDTVRAIRIDAGRVWFDNAIPGAPNMIAFDGNFNTAIETAIQTLNAPSVGLHTLNVQMRDSTPSHWGPIFKSSFVIENPLSYRNISISSGQLYWDNDTNNNPSTLIAFDGAFDNSIESAIKNNLTTPGVGLHTLCARFKDVANNWSNPFKLILKIDDSLFARNIKLVQGEVRIDNTPPLTIVALNGNFSSALETAQASLLGTGIPTGLHRLLVRLKGLDGNWGPYFITSIVVTPCATTPLPTVSNSAPLTFCQGDSTVLTANSGFSSYTWISNNTVVGTGQTFVAHDSGSYAVVVTDATNCPGVSQAKVVNVHHPVVTISTSPLYCQGTTDSLFATTGFSSYLWSAGSTTNRQYISGAGSYTVTVHDSYGCTAS